MPDGNLPEGVVTFLFTDIEGSTRLVQSEPERYGSILDAHRRVIRETVARHEGFEVKTDGDGFFIAFASPTAAVLAAAAAQRGLAGDPLLREHSVAVRMGMHTGEAKRAGHDYVGLAVHHAARVANAGHGGQVLVSGATKLMSDSVGDLTFDDLGEHMLKDLARPVHMFQLRGEGLAERFPPLRSLNSSGKALPAMPTSFVGRGLDLKMLLDDLAEPGLVTLTGPGGTGKTRLAIEAARQVSGSLDGTWFVDLLVASDAAQVLTAVAAALDVLDIGQADSLVDRLCQRLGSRPYLVVLDNCEHVVEPVADLADRLLSRCSQLRILATSRDLLGLPNERARRVPPLEPENAIELFVDRAARVVSGFAPTDEERRMIGDICRRLDGIPLAIELAAPRLRHIPLTDFAERLGDVFRLLVGSPARGLQRHQTLQAVVDWSHNLLSADEQVVLRRLSALTGSFSMKAAEAVAGGEPVVGAVEDIVFRLVDHSLVEHAGDGRYRQLETLRAYGQAKLSDSGEAAAVRDRQAAYFLKWSEALAPGLQGGRHFDTLEALDVEAENLHASLEWAAAQRDHVASVRLVAATVQFATITSRESYVNLADQALRAASGSVPPELLAAAHVEFGLAATMIGWSRFGPHATAAMDLLGAETSEPDEHDGLRAWSLAALALLSAVTELPAAAATRMYADRAASLASRTALPGAVIAARSAVAWSLMRAGDVPAARAVLAEVVESSGELRGGWEHTVALFWSGVAAMRAGDWVAATKYYQQVLPMYRRVSYKGYTQWVLNHLSTAALQLGDCAAARAYAEEGVTLSVESGLGADTNLPGLYERLGYLETVRDDYAQSARYYKQALQLMSNQRSGYDHAALQANLAAALVECGELEGARAHMVTALDLTERLETETRPTGEVIDPPVANVAQAVARLALAFGLADEAAELAGVVERFHPRETASPLTRERMDSFRLKVQSRLAEESQFDAAMKRGAALDDPLRRTREVLESTAGRE